MLPSTSIVRPIGYSRQRKAIQLLNGPYAGLFSTRECLKIRELFQSKKFTIDELANKYNVNRGVIKDIISGKHFPTCEKLNKRERRVQKLFG